jgi:hypothetical protein
VSNPPNDRAAGARRRRGPHQSLGSPS